MPSIEVVGLYRTDSDMQGNRQGEYSESMAEEETEDEEGGKEK